MEKLSKLASEMYVPSLPVSSPTLAEIGKLKDSGISSSPIRLSSLGKSHLFELVALKLGLIKEAVHGDKPCTEAQNLTFILGYFIEAWLENVFDRIGYKVLDKQIPVSWNGISGHADFIIQDEFGTNNLIECKSCNDYYFKLVRKFGVYDDRGYLTQLLTYQDCIGLPAYWVFINKNDSSICVIPLDSIADDVREEKYKRAVHMSEVYEKTNCERDLYANIPPIPPAVELAKGELALDSNGLPKLYAPSSVKYPHFSYKTFMGRTGYGKVREYVSDYLYPEKYVRFKPDIYSTL
jgi:hypothetical protein